MPAVVGWIVKALGISAATLTPFLIVKIFTFLGVAFVTFKGLEPYLLDAQSQILSALGGSSLAPWLAMAKVDVFFSMVFSAIAVRMSLGIVKLVRRPAA